MRIASKLIPLGKLKRLLFIALLVVFACEDKEKDCAGVEGGTTVVDCSGECGGSLVEDECGVCDGDGSTCILDYDGNIYSTIQIGDQLWLVENLQVTHYNNGDEIPTNYGYFEWEHASSGAYAIYDEDSSIGQMYGFLYNWFAVGDERGICPIGWHVPSDDEFTILVDYIGGEDIAGGKMKESGHEHWGYYSDEATEGATNESGFTALPGGFRHESAGSFHSLGSDAYFWSSTEMSDGGIPARCRQLYKEGSLIDRTGRDKNSGFSVRCVKD